MRKGSNFVGTEEDLQNAMRENLAKFVSDLLWLETVQEKVSEQEFINIGESIAECVDRGYLNNTDYLVLGNKQIHFKPKMIFSCEYPDDMKPFILTDLGKAFLGL